MAQPNACPSLHHISATARHGTRLIGLAVLFTALNFSNALLGQPANDLCSGAILLQPGVPFAAATTNATETGDPVSSCAGVVGRGVWFRFVPASDGAVRISTCQSDFDTVLQVFVGDCAALMPLPGGCDDDEGPACPEFQASVQFLGSAGVTYWILAGGATGANGTLRILGEVTPPLPNDQCGGAITLQPGMPLTMSTTGATETADPALACAAASGGGVWFRFTPTSDGIVRVSTCGSDFDTVLQIFTGHCAELMPVPGACSDDQGPLCADLQASVKFAGQSGVTYWILAGGAVGNRGQLTVVATVVPPVANDQCAGAVVLSPGVPVTMSTTNATETADPLPSCSSAFGGGLWFRLTPPTNAVVTISTCGSDFNTVLQVYSGGCDALAPVACNDFGGPACSGFAASAQFFGEAERTYWILAGGYEGAVGNLRIVADLYPSLPNDPCSGAITLHPGLPLTMNTATATDQGDPLPSCRPQFGGGVWFVLTPTNGGLAKISTCGSDFDTAVEVYTGTCGALLPVAGGCGDNDGPDCAGLASSVQFVCAPGVTYWILAGGSYGARGALTIAASIAPALANDLCAGAVALQPGVPVTMATTNATRTGDPLPSCSGALDGGVWFNFTPPQDGIVRVSTCGSDFDTVLQIFTGHCAELMPVPGACNDDGGPACSGFAASAQFFGVGGVTYSILAGGFSAASGELRILAELIGPPLVNDECAGAIPLMSGVPLVLETRTATETSDPAPGCRTNFGGGIWFAFAPASDGLVTISTCGSDFDTVLQIFTGPCEGLAPVACNDSAGPACPLPHPASVQFRAVGGTIYRILAGGSFGARGTLKIVADPSPPANDTCRGAITLQPRVPVTIDTFFATANPDPAPMCRTNFGAGIWFTVTPASDGLVTISTCGSDFDTVLQVYSGGCDALVPVAGACNDDFGPACSGNRASARFTGAPGITYWILAGGYAGGRGSLRLEADFPPPPPPTLRLLSQPGAGLLLEITGAPHFRYTLQASVDLLDWRDIAHLTADPNGRCEFTDPATNSPSLFYRVRSP